MVMQPTFTPSVGIAASVTPLTFLNSTDMDFIVMQENDCDDAHLAVTGGRSLQRTNVSNAVVSTTVAMTQATVLKLCYATRESGGDSRDDYTELASSFTQRVPIAFDPMRTVTGAEQRFAVSHTANGDQVVWTQAADCGSTAGAATVFKTVEYTSGSVVNGSTSFVPAADICATDRCVGNGDSNHILWECGRRLCGDAGEQLQ